MLDLDDPGGGSFASDRSKQCSAACFDRFMTEDALDYIEVRRCRLTR